MFVRNRVDTIQYHGGFQSRELGQAPMLLVFLTPKEGVIISPASPDDVTVLATILQNCPHTMKPSDPLLLADGALCCGMYPAGKVAISRHLATPGFPPV